jgi:hypothetical protein
LVGLFTGTAYASFAAHKLVTGDTGTQDAGNHQLEINTNWNIHSVRESLGVFINAGYSLSSPMRAMDGPFGMK